MAEEPVNPRFNSAFMGKLQRPQFCDELINIGVFGESFKRQVESEINDGWRRNAPETVLSVSMDMKESAVNELSQICSISHLTCESEPLPLNASRAEMILGEEDTEHIPAAPGMRGATIDPKAAARLRSLRLQKKRLAVSQHGETGALRFYKASLRTAAQYKLKREFRPVNSTRFSMRAFKSLHQMVTVRVYMPNPPPSSDSKGAARQSIKISQEIVCMGHNTLAQLRDKIACRNDTVVINDCSFASAKPVQAKDRYRSGFFCINRVFYVDRRPIGAVDYSEPIRRWAEDHPRFTGAPFETRAMETTCLNELSVRLGYPYIYVHQGRCQHLVAFSDVRLMHPSDAALQSTYPLETARRPTRTNDCEICHRKTASWLTMEHNLTPTDPTYYCEECFRAYNYSNGRKMLGIESKAYPCNSGADMPAV